MQPAIAAQSAHSISWWRWLRSAWASRCCEPLMGRMKTRGSSEHGELAKSGLQWEVGHIWQQSGYLSHAARAWLEV